jgi:hypothetical protein
MDQGRPEARHLCHPGQWRHPAALRIRHRRFGFLRGLFLRQADPLRLVGQRRPGIHDPGVTWRRQRNRLQRPRRGYHRVALRTGQVPTVTVHRQRARRPSRPHHAGRHEPLGSQRHQARSAASSPRRSRERSTATSGRDPTTRPTTSTACSPNCASAEVFRRDTSSTPTRSPARPGCRSV